MYLHHIAIWVRDLERMRVFYERYFKAVSGEKYHNPAKGFQSYFLRFSRGAQIELMHLERMRSVSTDRDESIGLAHFALSLGSREQVDALTNLMRNDGYTVAGEPRVTGDGYYESVILDPEGNRVELTE